MLPLHIKTSMIKPTCFTLWLLLICSFSPAVVSYMSSLTDRSLAASQLFRPLPNILTRTTEWDAVDFEPQFGLWATCTEITPPPLLEVALFIAANKNKKFDLSSMMKETVSLQPSHQEHHALPLVNECPSPPTNQGQQS